MYTRNHLLLTARFGPVALAIALMTVLPTTPGATGNQAVAAPQAQTMGPVAVDDSISDRYSERRTTMTRWVDPAGSRPITYSEWIADYPMAGPLSIGSATQAGPRHPNRATTEICILVNSSLYGLILPSLDRYVLELTGEGYTVEVDTASGGTPADLRTFLQTKYAAGMDGCLLIGDLPVPWFETDFGDPPEHAEFPIDLFYMDMDGAFMDFDGDDLYDVHTGNVAPEIWLGRLTASPLTLGGYDEASLLEYYFDKNHRYRSGLFPAAERALVYIDDDWAGGAGWWNLNVGEAYGNRTFVADEWTTWAPDYESRLPENYEFIQVCAHSWPGGHGFKNPSEDWSWTYVADLVAIDPPAHFYNLFACSNARYVEADYMSGWYVFREDYGLAAIGSTKSGSMLYFEDFYRPFGDGLPIGEAFRSWFADRAQGGFEEWEITWFYGMTLNGDPTLVIQQKANTALLQFDDGQAQYMYPLPGGSGSDLYNVRFTPAKPCTLSSVSVDGSFPETTPARMYIWKSDGVYPSTIVDSVNVPDGDLHFIDVYERNIAFDQNEDFHVGFTFLDPVPPDTAWLYMDDGEEYPEPRSGLYQDGAWKTLWEAWGGNYNFLIRVEVRYPEEPSIAIATTSLPDAVAGQAYPQPVDFEGGTSPFTWDVTAGELPDGLALNATTGAFDGAPLAAGQFFFTVRVTDSDSPPLSDVQHLNLNVTFICGDINCDGGALVDAGDLVYLVDFMFSEGPPPMVPEAADVDGSGGDLDIADLVYLVDFMFNSGPAPDCP